MSSPKIVLSGIGPKLEGLSWESDKCLRIGRQGSVDVVLRDFSVDRLHADVRLTGGRWVVRDLSQSPTYPSLLNGMALGRGDHPVSLNDILQFGKIYLKVTNLDTGSGTVPVTPAAGSGLHVNGHASGVNGRAPVNGQPSHANGTHAKEEPSKSAVPDVPMIQEAPPVAAAPVPPLATTPQRHVPEGQESIKTSGSFVKVQARTHQSWDQALELVAFGPDQKTQQGQAMLTLLRANHHLVHITSLEELVNAILGDAITALGAQRGSIALYDESTGKLEMKANLAPQLAPAFRWIYSRTLAERSFRLGESLLCQDVNADDDLLMARSVRQGAMASIICALLRTPRKRIGVLQMDRGPFQEPFTENDLYLVDAIAASAAVGIESAQMVEQQRDQFVQTVTTLARAVELRDQYTGDHTKRVTDYALLLAEELKVPALDKYQIQLGTPLHDIGKIGIEDAILRKPGKLTTTEMEHMKTHTIKGAAILQTIGSLAPMIPIVRHHHERWDGSGYPDRLSQNEIALVARIVAVADAFDAMTSHRPYRPAMGPEQAFLELLKQSGAHFDPTCVQAFLRQRRKVEHLLTGR